MQNVLIHVSHWSSHLTGKHSFEKVSFQHSVSGGYYIALIYDFIRDVFVLFTFEVMSRFVY